MTLSQRNRELVIAILRKSKSLDDAEHGLARLVPLPSKAESWGLYDGWSNRPRSISGVVITSVETPLGQRLTQNTWRPMRSGWR